ncbi:hypothetical protein [Silvibacterium acidisoli]|uniref:hypothetical protein n=1 Tax=Acidobacteriaceae bacterium ZG23-2 TaxID=2883246 RepID=UPI00406D496B
MKECTDQVVGDILSSWRYDISGISPEMRTDYESHLTECDHCRRKQQLHRMIDVVLIGLSTVSVLAFLFAIAIIHRFEPLRQWALVMHLDHRSVALTLQMGAFAGLLVSIVCWILIAIATPAPVYLTGMAQSRLHGRLPRNVA